MSLEENRAEHVRARQTAHMDIEEPQPEAGSGLRQPQAPVSGHVEILNYNEEGNNREPYERIREASLKKDQDLQSHRKDKQSANLQNLVLERIDARIQREEAIEKAYAQLATLKKHVEELSQADRQARAELIDSIKRKNLLRQKNADKNSELRHEQKKRLSEESKNHNNEKQKEIEAKQLLNEIIKLKQNHEEVGKRIDKLKQDRESHKLKVQKDESAARKAEEKEDIKRRLEGLVLRIAEKNKLFSKEYLSVRVLNEQVSRLKHHARVLAVLVPKENVANPFLLQTYLKVSKQHKNLSVLNNEKILHPEKHALTDLEDRVGNVEMYAQGVDCSEIIEKIIDKGSNKSVVAPLRKSAPRKAEIDFNDIVSLENSEEEDEDAAEIVGTTINLAENQRGVNESVLPAGKKLSENAVHLAKLLAPDPVKVFNDALILKKSTKRQAQPGGQTTCRFDQIIANDYISTYFDNNVAIRLYFELEIFIKSLLYRNFDRVLQKVTFYSDEYRKILNSDGQRSNFNLHYHTEGALPDVNELLHSKVVDNSKANVKVVSVEGFSVSEADIKKAKFINYVLPQGRGDSMPLQADNKEPEKGAVIGVHSECDRVFRLQELRAASCATQDSL